MTSKGTRRHYLRCGVDDGSLKEASETPLPVDEEVIHMIERRDLTKI